MVPTRAQIQAMADRLAAEFAVDRVVLFGSHARGQAGPDSDIDLLVVHRFVGSRIDEAARMRARLDSTLSIDLVLRRPEELDPSRSDFLSSLALREGQTLYDRAA